MEIIVCAKQVIDPEAPPSSFKIDSATNRAEMRGAPPVVDPYSEYAVEASLKLKDTAGARITVISMGNGMLREVIKKPLAMGADELVLLEDEAFVGGDNFFIASAIASAVTKLSQYDLILCGREASDTNAGQTGPGIAEILGIPCITLVKKIEINNNQVRVERSTSEGYDVIETGMPVVMTISNEIGEPRYPTIKGIMAAKKKEPVVWKPSDIGLDLNAIGKRAKLGKLYQPVHEARCEFMEADTPEEAAAKMAEKLREAKIL